MKLAPVVEPVWWMTRIMRAKRMVFCAVWEMT
jgi:hypothetical protein